MKWLYFILLTLILVSCSHNPVNGFKELNVYLQPYNNFSTQEASILQADIQNCFDTLVPEISVKVHLLEVETLPKKYINTARHRYRADSIIRNQHPQSGYILGLTHSDISTTAHGINDFGVLGLSFCPGHSAVVSDYRVSNKSLFYKVGVHELLHCFGLKHCPNNDRNCYICDANKKPQLEKQIYICGTCKQKLIHRCGGFSIRDGLL